MRKQPSQSAQRDQRNAEDELLELLARGLREAAEAEQARPNATKATIKPPGLALEVEHIYEPDDAAIDSVIRILLPELKEGDAT